MNWQDKVTVKKGNIGEDIVNQYLIKHGYIPYVPVSGCAHPFDRLCASRDKKRIFIADSKAKPARIHYPDSGIDMRHYEVYKNIQERHNLDVFIFFVDEDRGLIYGNFLKILDRSTEIEHKGLIKKYPSIEQDKYSLKIYFPLIHMRKIGEIPEEELKLLRELSTRNKTYTEMEKRIAYDPDALV